MARIVAEFDIKRFGTVEITKLDASMDDAQAYARPFQEVLLSAWERRFAQDMQPPMTTAAQIRERFNPQKQAKIYAQRAAIQSAPAESATYFAAELRDGWKTAVIGLGKVISYRPESKLKAIAGKSRYPYPYIHDVDVRPGQQKLGVGSALLLAMMHDFGPRKPVSLYAYEGNQPAIDWFTEDLGFIEKDRTEELDLLGTGTIVNQIHFEAPSVAGVRAAILERRPELQKVA